MGVNLRRVWSIGARVAEQYGKTADTWSLIDRKKNKALDFTTLLSCDISREADAANEPVEKGTFATYNKTIRPVEIRVSLGMMGPNADIDAALAQLDEWFGSPIVLSFLTPEREYPNMTLVGTGYAKTTDTGLGYVEISLDLREIREVEPAYTTVNVRKKITATKNPQHQSTRQRGAVETKDVGPSILHDNIGVRIPSRRETENIAGYVK